MKHKLACITGGKQYDITPLVGSVSWSDSLDTLGVQLDFDVAFNNAAEFPVNPVQLGSQVALSGAHGEAFRGFVVQEDRAADSGTSYTCFDGLWYLNKSKGVYKFKDVASEAAIRQILGNFQIPVGAMPAITTKLDQIYIEQTLAEIILDILARAAGEIGQNWRMEMRAGKFTLYRRGSERVSGGYEIAKDVVLDVATVPSIANRKRSIEGTYNIIKIVSDDHVIGEARDAGLISQYGKLQEVQGIDGKDVAQATQIAQNLLKELGRVADESTIEMLGDDRVRAGRLMSITEPVTGMSGEYLVSDVSHTDANGIHTMRLTLEVNRDG